MTTTLENKNIGFTFTIEMPKIQDIDNAYLLFQQGIVEDTKGNQNNLTKIVLSTKLLAVGNETGPNSGFLGNTNIKRKDIQRVEFVNNVNSQILALLEHENVKLIYPTIQIER